MEKSVQIIISVDDVTLSDLELILEAIDKLLEEYQYKRVDTNLQDQPLVKTPGF